MPDPIELWPDETSADPRDRPTLTPMLAAQAPQQAMVIVCPGGGYGGLAGHEAEPISQWLNGAGFHSAVLRYRLGPRHRHPCMINDVQRAVRMVRERAGQWGVHPRRIAVLGFSAGGHLVSSLATHFDRFIALQDDLASKHSARPDAVVLCYPVIDLSGEHRHDGSRQNLLGPTPDEKLVELLSNHKQVTRQSPPAFLWHTADDGPVPMENSLMFAAACRRNGVPVELHVYDSGPHGMGLASGNPTVGTWTDLCEAFLRKYLGSQL